MENVGKEPMKVHATVHGPGYSGADAIGGEHSIDRKFAGDFHTFAVEWKPDGLQFYADGRLYHSLTPATLPAGKRWVFNQPFYILLNLAVGGAWPGYPDATTVFPQTMTIDYVRVYQLTK